MTKSKYSDPFSDTRLGLIYSDLRTQGGQEEVIRILAEALNAPIYTLDYEPEKFDKRAQEVFRHRVRKIPPEEGVGDSPTDFFEPQGAEYKQIASLSNLREADTDRIVCDGLIAISVKGAVMAEHAGIPYITFLDHPGKVITDYFWETLDNKDRWRDKLKFLKRRWVHSRAYKQACLDGEGMMANSERTKQLVVDDWGFDPDDIDVVYPPIDTEKFTPGEPERDVLDLNRYFLAPQRVEAYKNIHTLVEAAKLAQEHLVIVGTGTLESYVRKEAQYSKYVHYLGYVDDDVLRDLYRDATATMQGVLREDFGMVPVESMACGTPCLLPGSGGFNETVGPGYDGDVAPTQTTPRGRLVDPEEFDHYELAGEMQAFDPEEFDAEHLVETAQQYDVDNFVSGIERNLDALDL
ncbi:glycosyltransferase family 4 protein [Halorussus sp. MSC15.2]|uniref:glycosyltransferase family 4 protein n=1 Tax=Halorussus sp. MSC15.2 TaxID=2283638 RepID=UPI0013D8083D|nr:glycosyltransferase family 4 protein [Halorussus sp. MSC15.2]NEU58605.1 glycosyltransferase family 4 protein [Halorussus sp. MSC15.2]